MWFWLTLTIGVLTGVVLVGGQYWRREPLMPVRPISDTLPVTGIAAAMVAGATFMTLIELTEAYLLAVPQYSRSGSAGCSPRRSSASRSPRCWSGDCYGPAGCR
ncbi:hypothetical protein [Streptomyces mayteni]